MLPHCNHVLYNIFLTNSEILKEIVQLWSWSIQMPYYSKLVKWVEWGQKPKLTNRLIGLELIGLLILYQIIINLKERRKKSFPCQIFKKVNRSTSVEYYIFFKISILLVYSLNEIKHPSHCVKWLQRRGRHEKVSKMSTNQKSGISNVHKYWGKK